MKQKVVCIDIGNTYTKFGFFKADKLYKTYKIANVDNPEIPPTESKDTVVITSVNKKYERIVMNKLSTKNVYWLGKDIKLSDIPMVFKYDNINILGKDRICFAFYSYKRFKGKVLNISFGTALVIDYIDGKGVFKGGIIAAGPTLAVEALKSLDGLKNIKFIRVGRKIAGNSTDECISLGIVNAIIQLIKFYVEKTRCEHIVISGGNYFLLKPYLDTNFHYLYEPHAVLSGLYSIYKETVGKKFYE